MADVTVAELHKQLVHSWAVEATIWGMPAVSMAAVRRSLKRDLDADFGDVIYFVRRDAAASRVPHGEP